MKWKWLLHWALNFQEAVAEWLDSDVTDPGHQIMEDDEIVANALTEGNSDDESEEEEDYGVHSITPRDAFNALDVSLQWLESQGTDPAHLLLVKKWHDTVARMRCEPLRKTDITSFFTRTD